MLPFLTIVVSTTYGLTMAEQTSKCNAEHKAFLAMQRLADVLMGQVADLLKPSGLSPTQYNVLRILRGHAAWEGAAGSSDCGLACSQIGRDLITRDPDITRLLDRLEARTLIARTREAKDRRVIRTRITPDGLNLLEQLDQPIQDLHRKQFSHLKPEQLRQLLQLLEEVFVPFSQTQSTTLERQGV